MRIDKIINDRQNAPLIVWHETRTETMDQQLNPDAYIETIVEEKRHGRVLFVTKKLVKK